MLMTSQDIKKYYASKKYCTQSSESRLAVLLVGLIQLTWGMVPIFGNQDMFTVVLRHYDGAVAWLGFMGLSSILLIAGALLPLRTVRHIGLFLSAASWGICSMLWLKFWADHNQFVMSVDTVTLPLMAVYAIVLLVHDVANHPQNRGRNRNRR